MDNQYIIILSQSPVAIELFADSTISISAIDTTNKENIVDGERN